MSFETAYASVPEEQRRELSEWRHRDIRRSCRVGGHDWGYEILGGGDRTLVFLPGGFARADMWLRPMKALSSRFRVVAIDCSLEVFDPHRCCEAICRIADAEAIDRFAVIGTSYGGGLAQYLLQSAPQRVEHAILSHCTPVGPETGRRLVRMLEVTRWMPRVAIDLQWSAVQRAAGPASTEWAVYARAYLEEVGRRVSKDVLVRFLRESGTAAVGFDFDPSALGEWAGEIMIMSSRDDPTTFPYLDELRDRYPGAEVRIFDTGGHATLLFRPDAYLEALEAFIGRAYSVDS